MDPAAYCRRKRIKSELDPHVDQEPHQMFGEEHVMEWCKLEFGFVQQVADQTAKGSLEDLLDLVKVCVTNKSEVELHMLDRELLSVLAVFLGNLPKEPAQEAVGTYWIAHGLFKHVSAGSRGIDDRRCLSQSISWTQSMTSYRSSLICPGDI